VTALARGSVPATARATRTAGGASGTITRFAGDTITLSTASGTAVTVTLAANAPVIKLATGGRADLHPGQRVLVRGERAGNTMTGLGVEITDLPPGVDFPGAATATPTP